MACNEILTTFLEKITIWWYIKVEKCPKVEKKRQIGEKTLKWRKSAKVAKI